MILCQFRQQLASKYLSQSFMIKEILAVFASCQFIEPVNHGRFPRQVATESFFGHPCFRLLFPFSQGKGWTFTN